MKPEEICTLPGNLVFLDLVRRYRDCGFGWMQQLIELEWRRVSDPPGGAWGPYYFEGRIKELEEEVERLKSEALGHGRADHEDACGVPETVII